MGSCTILFLLLGIFLSNSPGLSFDIPGIGDLGDFLNDLSFEDSSEEPLVSKSTTVTKSTKIKPVSTASPITELNNRSSINTASSLPVKLFNITSLVVNSTASTYSSQNITKSPDRRRHIFLKRKASNKSKKKNSKVETSSTTTSTTNNNFMSFIPSAVAPIVQKAMAKSKNVSTTIEPVKSTDEESDETNTVIPNTVDTSISNNEASKGETTAQSSTETTIKSTKLSSSVTKASSPKSSTEPKNYVLDSSEIDQDNSTFNFSISRSESILKAAEEKWAKDKATLGVVTVILAMAAILGVVMSGSIKRMRNRNRLERLDNWDEDGVEYRDSNSRTRLSV